MEPDLCAGPSCGKALPPYAGKGPKRRYCSAACRQRAYRHRYPELAQSESLARRRAVVVLIERHGAEFEALFEEERRRRREERSA